MLQVLVFCLVFTACGPQTRAFQLEAIADGEIHETSRGAPSPLDTSRRAFEQDDAIWLSHPPGRPIKLTADDDYATLRTRQREGEVILYWATNPVWSADGRQIAFVTNRESVRGGPEVQSIWLIDVASRAQRPLVAEAGDAVRVEGALADEFLFSSSARPGVLAVKPATGAVRQVADGFLLTADPRGRAAAIAQDDDGQRSITIVTPTSRHAVTAPGDGYSWSTQAHFSPSARSLALVATDNAGAYRLYAFDRAARLIAHVDMPGGPVTIPRWRSETEIVFSSSRPREPIRTWVARLR